MLICSVGNSSCESCWNILKLSKMVSSLYFKLWSIRSFIPSSKLFSLSSFSLKVTCFSLFFDFVFFLNGLRYLISDDSLPLHFLSSWDYECCQRTSYSGKFYTAEGNSYSWTCLSLVFYSKQLSMIIYFWGYSRIQILLFTSFHFFLKLFWLFLRKESRWVDNRIGVHGLN